MQTLQETGLVIGVKIPYGIKVVSKVQRLPTIDKQKSKNGWIYYPDADFAVIGNYETNEKVAWSQDSPFDDQEERGARIEKRMQEQREIEQEERAEQLANLRRQYKSIFGNTRGVSEHPYIIKKKIEHLVGLRLDWQSRLTIPMYNQYRELVGLQKILDDGTKRFGFGSQPNGAVYPIIASGVKLGQCSLIIVVEGYASGSSLYKFISAMYPDENVCVLVAFSAANLYPVYELYRAHVICCDNDETSIRAARNAPKFRYGYTKGYDSNDMEMEYWYSDPELVIEMTLKLILESGWRKNDQ